MCSSSGLPSLATVVDLFLPIPGRKRDCRKVDLDSDFDSDLGVGGPSLLAMLLLPRLFIRKKFLIFVGRGVVDSLECFFEEKDKPEKLRFSVDMTEPAVEW